MTQETQTKEQIRVDHSANRLSELKKSTFLKSIFKNIILKKFKNLKVGYIHITDGKEVYEFGDKKSELQSKINILSSEFYVFLNCLLLTKQVGGKIIILSIRM